MSGQPYCYQCGVDREGDWLCDACRPETTDTSDARIAELEAELCNVIRQWSDDYMDLVGYPVDVTELSALAQAVWAVREEAP